LGGLPYLKRLGHTVAIAPSNAQAVDIFVADDRGRPISMRVKARTNANHWGLPPDAERMEDQRHFYCLVDLGRTGMMPLREAQRTYLHTTLVRSVAQPTATAQPLP
jgi:hypothetical protein